MVTASHNPKQDNGFKLYWGNGSQIIPPHDSGIAAAIAANLQPWQTYAYDKATVRTHPLSVDVKDEVSAAYYDALMRLCDHPAENSKSRVKVVYTGATTYAHQLCATHCAPCIHRR